VPRQVNVSRNQYHAHPSGGLLVVEREPGGFVNTMTAVRAPPVWGQGTSCCCRSLGAGAPAVRDRVLRLTCRRWCCIGTLLGLLVIALKASLH
jgi:hypothetical protein